jgi:hypothetical protein
VHAYTLAYYLRVWRMTAKDRHYNFRTVGTNTSLIAVNEEPGFLVSKVLQFSYDRQVY